MNGPNKKYFTLNLNPFCFGLSCEFKLSKVKIIGNGLNEWSGLLEWLPDLTVRKGKAEADTTPTAAAEDRESQQEINTFNVQV